MEVQKISYLYCSCNKTCSLEVRYGFVRTMYQIMFLIFHIFIICQHFCSTQLAQVLHASVAIGILIKVPYIYIYKPFVFANFPYEGRPLLDISYCWQWSTISDATQFRGRRGKPEGASSGESWALLEISLPGRLWEQGTHQHNDLALQWGCCVPCQVFQHDSENKCRTLRLWKFSYHFLQVICLWTIKKKRLKRH